MMLISILLAFMAAIALLDAARVEARRRSPDELARVNREMAEARERRRR